MMKIKKVIGISAVAVAGASIGAMLMKKHQENRYGELFDKVIDLVGNTLKYDDGLLELAEEKHKMCIDINKKYKQLCKEYDVLQSEYNEMLDYYNED